MLFLGSLKEDREIPNACDHSIFNRKASQRPEACFVLPPHSRLMFHRSHGLLKTRLETAHPIAHSAAVRLHRAVSGARQRGVWKPHSEMHTMQFIQTLGFGVRQMAVVVKNRGTPKWVALHKWKHGLKPAVPWWGKFLTHTQIVKLSKLWTFDFGLDCAFHLCASHLFHRFAFFPLTKPASFHLSLRPVGHRAEEPRQ